MPNQPGQDTVTISFTLPRALNAALEARAAREMTNKSDIIRRALMNHLTPEERANVLATRAPSSKLDEAADLVLSIGKELVAKSDLAKAKAQKRKQASHSAPSRK